MRCLYCGKELALFKRLRGGEFCSDAHRQQYQEEYTQLALNRLLQAAKEKEKEKEKDTKAQEARPPEPESPALKRREKLARETPAPAALAPAPAPTRPAPASRTAAIPMPAATLEKPGKSDSKPQTAVLEPATAPRPQAQNRAPARPATVPAASAAAAPPAAPAPVKEERAPAEMIGFLVELPDAAEMGAASPAAPTEAAWTVTPVLPRFVNSEPVTQEGHLSPAEPIELFLFTVADFQAAPKERGLELREFVRGVPPVEITVKPAVETGFEPVREECDVQFDAAAPSGSPTLWITSDAAFPSLAGNPEIHLGDLARLDFALTEWGTGIDTSSVSLDEPSAPSREAPAFEGPALAGTARMDPFRSGPAAHPASVPQTFRPEPVHFEPVHIDPTFMEKIAGSPELRPSAEASSPTVKEPLAEEAAVAPEVLVPAEPEPTTSAPAEPPRPVTRPVPVTLHGLSPARGKPVQVFTSAVLRTGELQTPRATGLPLRPVMVLGAATRPAPAATSAPAVAPAVEKADETKSGKPAVQVTPEQPKVRTKPDLPNAESRPQPVRVAPVKLDQGKGDPVRPEPSKPEPAKAPPKKEGAPELAASVAKSQPASAEPKSPAPKRVDPKYADLKFGKPLQPEKPPVDIRAVAVANEPDLLGLPKLTIDGQSNFWTRLPGTARLAVIAGVLALAIGGIVLTSRSPGSPKNASPVSTEPVYTEGNAIATGAGWMQDWFADRPGAKSARHVDVLRGSMALRDYRLLFEGQIEQGALGWVFRANEKSFYVEKIQVVTPGLNPTVALVRFLVLNGKEQERKQIPLAMQVHLDTTYKVRMDVMGNHFTTWVQDQKVDQWTDGQIEAGGVGLYYENGDSAKLRDTLNVIPLQRK